MQYNKILSKTNILYLTWSLWGILGFKRGIDQYEYEYKYLNNKMTYIYTEKIIYWIIGFIIYINPVLLHVSISKEIYRIEINIRK